jgi:transposase
VTAADEDTAVEVDVVAGQRHDAPLVKPMLDKTAVRIEGIDEVVGDKEFDGEPQRQACREHGAQPVMPAKTNRVAPEPLDADADRQRNRIERLFGKVKEFRRVATRYDKRKRMYLGWLHLVLGFIRLRAKTKPKSNVNTAWASQPRDGHQRRCRTE